MKDNRLECRDIIQLDGVKYFVRKKLGEGGVGAAFQAASLEEDSAQSVVLVKSLQSPRYIPVLERAAVVRAGIRDAVGPEVLTDFLTDKVQEPGRYFVYTYAHGKTLKDLIRGEDTFSGEMIQKVRSIVAELYRNIFVLIDEGVVHRDICASNMICRENELVNGPPQVNLIDPDLLARADSKYAAAVGRALYLPPEVFSVRPFYPPGGDLFAAGVLTTRALGRIAERALGIILLSGLQIDQIMVNRMQERGCYFGQWVKPEDFVQAYKQYPWRVRDVVYGILQLAAASMQNTDADRPKSMEEVRQLLYSTPNLAWTVYSAIAGR